MMAVDRTKTDFTFDFTGGEAVVDRAYDFVTGLGWDDIPADVRDRAKLLLLDLVGVLASGTATPVSRVIRDFAADQFGPGGTAAHLPLDGRAVSPAGAALATGMTIDSIDAHDGHRLTKGHVGCGVLAALLAYGDDLDVADGRELLTCLVLGYELGTRAARTLHEPAATAAQYHSSGAWIALAAAAIGARLMGLDRDRFRHALAIAEYHGPRSQVAKVANHPTMLKDGSGWGAMAGVSAAYLARSGFTGAPVIMLERHDLHPYWADLGTNWEVLAQYVKPEPVCRWTQPATEAARELLARGGFDSRDIEGVTVDTFLEATLLSQEVPTTTEEAQYNVRFPLAVLLARGRVGAAEITDDAVFRDPEILRLHHLTELRRDPGFDARFPAERWSVVRLRLADGRELVSQPTVAPGDPETMLSRPEFEAKFRSLAEARLGPAGCAAVIRLVDGLDGEAADWPGLRRLLAGDGAQPSLSAVAP